MLAANILPRVVTVLFLITNDFYDFVSIFYYKILVTFITTNRLIREVDENHPRSE